MSEMLVVRAGIPEQDDCPILTRLKAFIVDQGVPNVLEHVMRDRKGNPVDLSSTLAYPVSEQSANSSSYSTSLGAHGRVVLRARDWLGEGINPVKNPIFTMWGEGFNSEKGVVRVQLDPALVERAGIYELNWAILDPKDTPMIVDRGLLSVERSMFPKSILDVQASKGPPTLQEVRMLMMDSTASENLLLDDVEFKDEQIMLALTKPVQLWNESPPPIETFTTRNFPFRGAWTSGAMGQLHLMAANHYRRNYLKGQSEDLDKEQQYMAEGQRLWQEYQAWMANKKVAINFRKFFGASLSEYAFRNGWGW